MRKWAFLYSAAAIAVVGCGGSGTGNSHSSGTTGTGKSGVITIKLSNSTTTPPGAIEVAYLTGQGRAPGDLTAVVQQLRFNDAYGEVTNPLAPLTTCPLAGFQNNIVRVDVPFTSTSYGIPSRIFTSFILDFLQFDEETDSPAVGDFTILSPPVGFPEVVAGLACLIRSTRPLKRSIITSSGIDGIMALPTTPLLHNASTE